MVVQWRVVALFFVLSLLFHSSYEQSPMVRLSSWGERLALVKLRSSLGLRSKEWPIKADPCSAWVGIQCLNGRVVGINISGFRRTRIGSQNPQFSVDALSNLTLLSSFNASRFLLPGSIPDWFGRRLHSLQVLDLRSCSIAGAIPSSVGNLTNLTTLYLSGNGLSGIVPASFGHLSRLSVLDLSRNSLIGTIPSLISSLGDLTLLDMSSNFLSGTIPPAIGTFSKLQKLNLSGNSLTSSVPAQLGDLSSLLDLDLSFNSLSGSLPLDLKGLRNLKRFIVGNNSLSGPLPDNLFSSVSELQSIVLSFNDFTGSLPDILWSMPKLRFLDASGNNFTGSLPNISSNTNTTAVFNLSNNFFYGGVTAITHSLRSIDLSGNYFQGIVLDSARTNAYLERNCLQNVSHQRTVRECSLFYSSRGMIFDNFGLPNATQPPPPSSNHNHHRKLAILAGVLGGFGFLLLVAFALGLLLCLRKRSLTDQRSTDVGPVPAVASPPCPGLPLNFANLGQAYTYQQVLQAVKSFSDENLIKRGHSGELFRGVVEGGIPVVIKRIDLRSVKNEVYMPELDFLSKVSHPRFVPVLGYCLDNDEEKFLIYKHMRNADLSNSLFRKSNSGDENLQSLDWITRLKIAIGAAEGLSYLHHECTPPLVHRDVQASSVLLDDKFEVRLGSLSEVCAQGEHYQSRFTRLLRLPQTSEQGASGTATTTCANDVYCFGKVLLELVTGKVGMSGESDATLKDWLEGTLPYISIYDKELVTNIVDPSLIIDEDLLEEVWAMAIVARSCLNPKPSRRPLMRYVLKALENPLKVVREENSGSARLRATSSRSWNASLFGSWRQSSSDVAAVPVVPTARAEGGVSSSLKQSGTSGSQGSGQNGEGHSSSNRRQSKEIFPEPLDVERQNVD